MDKLLNAMISGKEDLVTRLACDLFIKKDGQINKAQINEFERYAPCKINIKDINMTGFNFGGEIIYGGKRYYFG